MPSSRTGKSDVTPEEKQETLSMDMHWMMGGMSLLSILLIVLLILGIVALVKYLMSGRK